MGSSTVFSGGSAADTRVPPRRRERYACSKAAVGHSSAVVTEPAYAELLGSTVRDELFAILDTAAWEWLGLERHMAKGKR
jgi:hypothetical protein